MAASGDELRRLRRGVRKLRRRAAGALVAAAAGVTALLFLLALWAVGTSGGASPLSLVFTLLLIVVAAGAAYAAGALTRSMELSRLARETETAAGLADGDVVAALELETIQSYDSSPLARLHQRRIGERLRELRGTALFPLSAPRWRRRLQIGLAGCLIVGAATALAAGTHPERALRTARSLATPWEAIVPAPLPPLIVLPGDTAVTRGADLPVQVRAEGRREVTLYWRVEGEVASSRTLPVDRDSTAMGHAGPIGSLTRYWVEDRHGRSTDTFLVRPVEPLLVTELLVRVAMPAYLGREDEEYSQPVPPLVVPEGSSLEITGRANLTLESVRVTPADDSLDEGTALQVAGERFSGELRPVRSGSWEWLIVPGESRYEIIEPLPLAISVIPDSLPGVEIVYPGGDTILHTDLQLPLVVDARDDIGLRRVELVSWRVSALGTSDEGQRLTIASGKPGETRLVARPTLDMRERNLLPGDTVYYFVRVRDGNPAHRAVVSDTFRARLPSMSEMREETAATTDRLAEDSRQLVDQAKDLEREAREAERKAADEAARAAQSTSSSREQRVSYEATEEARRVLQQASSMEEKLQEMQTRLEELREQISESGLADPALREKLAQLEELYRELLESGLREEIERLQEALRSLDPEELQRSLRDVAQSIRELQDKLEQSTALLERAAVEQAVKSARLETEQLAQQQAVAAAAESQDSSWADAEDRLATEAEQLMEELDELAQRLSEAGADPIADSTRAAGERLDSASRDMQRAARSARPQPGGQRAAEARTSASQASQATQEAAESLASAEKQLNEDWRDEAMAAVQRALGESLELAREQSRLSGISSESEPARADHPARQLAVREGLDNLLRSLSEASRKTALLDQRTGPAAAEAAERMDALLQRMQRTQGRSRPTPSEGRAIVNSLNNLAAGLMATARAIEGSQSATGMQEALEQLAQIAQTQQGVGQRTGGLLPLYQAGQQAQEQLAQLAREQAAIAQRLREMAEQSGGTEPLGRPEQMAAEADEIARHLRAGNLDPETVARQERLFRRLLDAGRSLEKEDEDPRKRESESATAGVRRDVGDLDPRLLTGPRFPHPNQQTLSRYPPGYRALIFDYFDRLNEGAAQAEPAAGTAGR